MYTYVATAILAAALSATGTWKIQQWRMDAKEKEHEWRMDAKEKEHVEQILDAERRAAAKAIRNQETVIAAQSEAARRAADLRRDAAGSRAALVGLSSSADQALRDAATSHAACTERAAAISQLLNQCGSAYQELGAIADRHASDVKTLMDAWPKD